MATNNNSIQTLSVQKFESKSANGETVITEKNVLTYCYRGQELFRKNFLSKSCKIKHTPVVTPFDFLLTAGAMGLKGGRFYEVEYFDSLDEGIVHRALIQCVDPVTDLQLVLGTLVRSGLLPKDFVPYQASLRNDIDMICDGSCSLEDDGEPYFFYGINNTNEETETIAESVQMYHHLGCSMNYRCGERLVEIWLDPDDASLSPKVFVCGSSNVNDPEFAERRADDFETLEYHLDAAFEILKNYNRGYCLFYDNSEDDSRATYKVESTLSIESIHDLCGKILSARVTKSNADGKE